MRKSGGTKKIGFNNINLQKIDKNFSLIGKKIEIKPNKFYLKEIIKRYKSLILPYLTITKKKTLFKNQINQIKSNFFD